MTAIVTAEGDHARPLGVLVALIKEGLRQAEAAAQPYYERIAPLLIEARDGHFRGDRKGFYAWGEKTFGKSQTTLSSYIAFSSHDAGKSFKNLQQFRAAPKELGGLGHKPQGKALRREWTAPVDAVAEQARRDAFRLVQADALTRAQERDADRRLAHRLIDIGYKVLAKELHPDKLHGDREAMARLNRVRSKLKHWGM